MDYLGRIARLRELIDEQGAEAAVVTRMDSIRYLCGFVGSFGDLIVTDSKALLVTDGRYENAARRDAREVSVEIGAQGKELVPEALGEGAGRRVLFDAEGVSVARLLEWQSLSEAEFAPAPGLLDGLRAVKDEEEIELIRKACRITDAAWDAIQPDLRPGATEIGIALRLAELQMDLGAESQAFCIVASGPNSAYPHHQPTARALTEGDLVKVDFGCTVEGYGSDLTRTVVLGEPTDLQRTIYDAVHRAQVAGCAAVRDGVTCDEVDRAARSIIEEAGFGERFNHGLGHGVGLAKDPPHVRPGYALESGNVVTIEPGIYIEGVGGVRIEDVLAVTDDGADILSRAPKPVQLSQPGSA